MPTYGIDRTGATSSTGTPNGGIPATTVDAKGDLLVGTAADTVGRLAVGANDRILVADSAETAGMKWATPAQVRTALDVPTTGEAILDTLIAAKGDLLVGTANDTVAVKSVGSEGTVLTADPSATEGVRWSAAAFTTGDVKLTLKTVADTGWVLMNDGTIGNASSGGTTRANADTEGLFTLLWTNVADAQCAVSTGRGASAAADYAANKTIALPKVLGRALAGYGSGSGLTARALAAITGAETHTLATSEIPAHTHGPGTLAFAYTSSQAGATTDVAVTTTQDAVGNTKTLSSGVTASSGGGGAHANMQPTLFLNVMIKL